MSVFVSVGKRQRLEASRTRSGPWHNFTLTVGLHFGPATYVGGGLAFVALELDDVRPQALAMAPAVQAALRAHALALQEIERQKRRGNGGEWEEEEEEGEEEDSGEDFPWLPAP